MRFAAVFVAMALIVGCHSGNENEKPVRNWGYVNVTIILRTEKGSPYIADVVSYGDIYGSWHEPAKVEDTGYGVWKGMVPRGVSKIEVIAGHRVYEGDVNDGICRIVVKNHWRD